METLGIDMNATLPKMGRPSITGLSIKELGEQEYRRQYNRKKLGRDTHPERWTGLSCKQLGAALYKKLWRQMRHNLNLEPTQN